MNFIPLAVRELRTSARQPFTFHLRLAGAGVLFLVTVVFAAQQGFGTNLGGKLFSQLHATLFFATWLFVPFLTADCISRERREGTLCLLFLTRLRPGDIVVAKGLVHGLRALTLGLAVLPVIAIPVLVGGITWPEGVLSVLTNFSAICLALTAGLLASSLSRVWTRVLVYAACLSLIFCILFVLVNAVLVSAALAPAPAGFPPWPPGQFQLFLGEGFWLALDWDAYWPVLLSRLNVATRAQLLGYSAAASLWAVLVLVLGVRFAAWRVRQVWQEEPPSARLVWLEQKLCTPVLFRSFFKRWLRRKLEVNPIGWLEQRSWSGRLVSWSWLGIVTCFYCVALTNARAIDALLGGDLHQAVAFFLGIALALSAATSFRRERETGVIELLLVSPISENDIILGRLRGLWAQFLPAIGLLMGIWLYLTGISLLPNLNPSAFRSGSLWFCMSAYFSVPVIGLYFSLCSRNFVGAFLATLAVGLLLPTALAHFFIWLLWLYTSDPVLRNPWSFPAGGAAFFQLLLAGLCWSGLHHRLRARAFPIQRS